MAVQPGLDDAGVVEDQQVAGPQQAGQVGEAPVMQLAGVIQVQQPAAGAFGGGRLGDELGRQLVVEVGNGERSGHAGIWQERAGGAGRRGRSSWNRPGRPAGSYRAGLGQLAIVKAGRPAGGVRCRAASQACRSEALITPVPQARQPSRREQSAAAASSPRTGAPSGDRSKPPCSPRLVSAPAAALGVPHRHADRIDAVQQMAADRGVAAFARGAPVRAGRGGIGRRAASSSRRVGALAQLRVPFGQGAGRPGPRAAGGIDPAGGAVEQGQHRADPHVHGHGQARVAPLHDGGAVLAPDGDEHGLADGAAQRVQAVRRQLDEIDLGQGGQPGVQRLRAQAVAGAGGSCST